MLQRHEHVIEIHVRDDATGEEHAYTSEADLPPHLADLLAKARTGALDGTQTIVDESIQIQAADGHVRTFTSAHDARAYLDSILGASPHAAGRTPQPRPSSNAANHKLPFPHADERSGALPWPGLIAAAIIVTIVIGLSMT